jgi:hypothetical protein
MIKIITYPKKKFDEMVFSGNYSSDDIFVSIGYTREIDDFEPGYDDPVIPVKYGNMRVKSVKPGFDTPEIPEQGSFLRVKFDDVIEDFGEHNRAFTQENAEEILKFCGHARPTSTIHIHCQAGQSRSAALGVALKFIYDEAGVSCDLTHTSSYVCPNKTVLRIMEENKMILLDFLNSQDAGISGSEVDE